MLLLAILIVAIAAFSYLAYIANKSYKYDTDALVFVLGALAIVCAGIFIVTSIGTISSYISKDADEARMQELYESLYNQAYYNMYDNANDIGKKELANQITEWNEKLESYKKFKESIWVSIEYPMDVDQFKTIPVTLLEGTVG